MQAAIDSAKRRFDVDIDGEIKRIKKDMNIEENGYPSFWSLIKRGFNRDKINMKLKCPMNYLYDIKLPTPDHRYPIIPMTEFFVKSPSDMPPRRLCKNVERLIEKYSLELYSYNISTDDPNTSSYLLLRNDFDQLIADLQALKLANKYIGLMSWLLDRCLCISNKMTEYNKKKSLSKIGKNKSLLMKVLYDTNKEAFLKCFSGHLKNE